MADKQIFVTVLEKYEKMDATSITIPFDVKEVFGAKRVPVKVSINGAEYRSTIFYMNKRYCVVIPKVFRQAAGIGAGETITVAVEKDSEKRTVEIPEAFAAALKKANLTETFEKMSYTHQKEYVGAINEAKKEETRQRRIAQAVEMIAARKR